MSRSSKTIKNKAEKKSSPVRITDHVVHVNIDPQTVSKYVRSGNDLVIHQANGKVIRIRGFFGDGDKQQLELVFDYNGGELKMAAVPSTIPLDDPTGDEVLFKPVENDDHNATGLKAVGMAAFAATTIGTVAAATNHGHRHGHSSSDGSNSNGLGDNGANSGTGNTNTSGNGNSTTNSGNDKNNNGNDKNNNKDNNGTNTKDTAVPDAPTLSFKSNPDGTVVASGRTIANGQVRVTFPDGTTKVVVADKQGYYQAKSNSVQDSGQGSAVVTDSHGKNSLATISSYVDDVKPNAAKILGGKDNQEPVVGEFKNHDYINDPRPEIYGSGAEPNALVRIYRGDTLLGSTRADASGNWTWKCNADLADGLYKIRVKVVDNAGNESELSNEFEFTILTVQPKAVTIDRVHGVDNDQPNGPTSREMIHKKRPTIEGSGADAEGVIYIYAQSSDGERKLLGTTVAGPDGKWSFVPSVDLKDDTYTFTANLVDKAGNVGKISDGVVIQISTTPPDAPIIDQYIDNTGSVTGEVAHRHSTDEQHPILRGHGAEAGSVVTIYDTYNGQKTVLGTTIAKADGSWEFDCRAQSVPVALDEGVHKITATSTDAAGNTSSESKSFDVTVDLTPPSNKVIIDHALDNQEPNVGTISDNGDTNDRTPTLVGSNAEAYGVVRIYVKTANGNYTYVGETKADSEGNWSFTAPTLPRDGSYTYQARATDEAGNEAVGSDGFTVNLDTLAPVIPSIVKVEKPTGDEISQGKPTNTTTPTISGTSEKDAIINIYDVNGGWIGSTKADGQGAWSFTPTSQMSTGMHNLYVTATDAAGNVSGQSAHFPFEISLQKPTTPTISRIEDDAQKTVENNGYTNDHTPKLYGRGEAGTEVTISVKLPGSDTAIVLGTVVVNSDGYWEFQTSYYNKDGLYKFIVTATNGGGNASDPSDYYVNLDFTPPAQPTITELRSAVLPKPGVVSDKGTTNDPAPLISGLAEGNSQVLIYIKGQTEPIGVVKADGQGKWSFRIPGLDEGTYEFLVYSVDQAGNKSASPATRTVTILTSFPETPTITGVYNDQSGSEVLIDNNKYTSDSTPVIRGTAKPGSVVYIYDGTVLLGTTTAGNDSSGSWSFKVPANNPLGNNQTHSLTAHVVNDAGQAGNPSQPWVVNVDYTAPDAPKIIGGRDTAAPIVDEFENGATINDKYPTLRGEGAEPYSTVKIYDALGNVVATVKADVTGQWKWTSSTELKDGHYSYTATVVDEAGNESDKSNIFGFDVKTSNNQVPAISSVTNSKGVAAITSEGVDWMNDDMLILHGTGAIKNGVVRIYDNGKVIGEVKAGPDGSWSFATDPLVGQNHNFTAKTVDAAGNESLESAGHAIKVDTVAPNQPIVSRIEDSNHETVVNGGYTNSRTPKLYGRAEKFSEVMIYCTLPGSDKPVLLGTVKANENGYWEFQTPSNTLDGLYKFAVKAKDAAGNISDETEYSVNLDFTPPSQPKITEIRSTIPPKPGSIAENGTTNDSAPFITGEAEKNSQVLIYIKGQTEPIGIVKVDSQGKWSFRVPGLDQGTYQFQVYAVDQAGNRSPIPTTRTVTVMTSYPDSPTITGVYDDHTGSEVLIESNKYTTDRTPVLHGTAKPGSLIYIYDGSTLIGTTTADNDSNGSWTFKVPASNPLEDNQTHTFTARVVNSSDQESNPSKPWIINVDHTPPEAPTFTTGRDTAAPVVDDFDNGATINDKRPTLRGEGAEPYSTVKIYDASGNVVATIKADAGGQWRWKPDRDLPDGHYGYRASVVDQAGNESNKSAEFGFDVKTSNNQVPTISKIVSSQGDEPKVAEGVNWLNDETMTLHGTGAIKNGIVRIYDNGKLIGEVNAGPDGSWSFTTDPLVGQKHSFTAKTVDAAGNESALSNIYDVKIDTSAPSQPVFDQYIDNTGSVKGEVANRHSTDEQHPILRGHGAEAGSVVTIYDTYNGQKTVLGTTIAKDDGSWEFDCRAQSVPVTLREGAHKITVTSTDAANNASIESAAFDVTVDLTPPSNKVIINYVSDDQEPQIGKVNNNGYTNDRTPTLVGSNAESNGIVRIYIKNANGNYTYVGETKADSQGNWSFTAPTLPRDGSYTYQARATDEAGNEAVGSDGFTVNLDTLAPVIPSIVKVEKPTGDEISQGKPTNTTTPTISGTSEKDAIINIYDVNGGWIGSTKADGQGAWSFTPTSQMSTGMHNLYVTATDAAGNVSGQSAHFPFEISLQKPTTPTISRIEDDAQKTVENNGYTNDHTPKLYGRGEAGTEVTISVKLPGSDTAIVLGTVVVNSDGYWEFQTSYYNKDGLYKFIVTATNGGGNASDPSDYYVNLDFTPPAQPTITELRSAVLPKPGVVSDKGTTNDPAPLISGLAEGNSQVLIYIKGQTEPIGVVKADGQGKWSFRIPGLDEGTYEFLVYSVDQAGNKSASPATRTVTILTSFPETPTITGVYNDQSGSEVLIDNNKYTSDSTPVIRGTAKPGSVVYIYDGTVLLGTTTAGNDSSGSWSFKVPANNPLGNNQTHSLTAHVVNDAGQAGNPSQPWVVNVDYTAPDAPKIIGGRDTAAPIVDEFENGATINDKYPTLRGEGAEPYSTVKIYDALGNVVATVKADVTGQWKWTSSTELKDGHYSYTATVVDEAGNESDKSNIFGFDVKTSNNQVPAISSVTNSKGVAAITSEGVDWMNDDMLILHGTGAIKNGVVRIYDNGKVIGEVKAGPDGSWSFATDPLVGQNHNFTAKTVDAAGNESLESAGHAIKVDTVAPNQPIVSRIEDSNHETVVNGGYTNSRTPKLYGRAEKFSEVMIYCTLPGSDKPVLLGTVKANENGYWEFQTPSNTLDGLYKFAVKAKDAAGNISDETEYSVNLDFTPPSQPKITEIRSTIPPKPGSIAENGTTNDSAPFITGEAEKNSQVLIYIKGQTEPIGIVKVDSQGKWSFRVPGLDQGTYQFQVYAVDQAGNRSPIPTTRTVTVMTSYPDSPTITGVYDDHTGSEVLIESNKYTTDRTPVLHGTAKPGSVIYIYDGSTLIGTTTAGNDSNGSWTFKVPANNPLEDNQTHTFTARVVDSSDQESNPSKPWVINVDHTPPEAPTFTTGRDTAAPVVDDFDNGATINDKRPTLRGEGAEPYSTVKIYDASGNVVATIKADAGGQWRWKPDRDLPDGHYGYRASVVDQAGNESNKSAEFGFDVKTSNNQVPTISKIVSGQGDEPKVAEGVNWLNKDVVTIKGAGAIKGKLVRIYDNGKLIGEVLSQDGTWSFTTDPLVGQKHSFTAKTVDAAGNESALSNNYDVQVDTVAPNQPSFTKYLDNHGKITGEVLNHKTTDETQPVLKGQGAEAGSVVTIYDIYNGQKTVLGTTIAKSDGSWEFDCRKPGTTVTLREGTHQFTVTSTDAANNTSAESSPFEVTVDLTPPSNKVTIDRVLDDQEPKIGTVNNNGYTNDRTPTLVGSNAESNGIVRIYVKNANGGYDYIGSTMADDRGRWSYTVARLSDDKDYTYQARAADEAGNEAVGSNDYTIKLDTTAPDAPTITSFQNTIGSGANATITDIENGLTNDSTPRLSGKAEKNSIITIYDGANILGTVQAGPDGTWYYDVPASNPLEGRRYNFQITATDAAGNVSEKSSVKVLEVNLMAPTAPRIDSIDDNYGLKKGKILNANDTGTDSFTDDVKPTIRGSGAARNSTVTIYDSNNVVVGVTTAGEKGEWSFQIPGEPGYHLVNGKTYEFFAKVTNSAGNTSLLSSGYKFTVDTTPPAQPTISHVYDSKVDADIADGKPTRNSSLKLSGEGETGSTVYIYDSISGTPVKIGEAKVINGRWSYTVDGLGNGSHVFTVRAVDEAMNITSDKNLPTWTVTVDNSVLPIPTIDKYIDDYKEFNPDGTAGSKEIPNNGKTNDKTPILEGTAPAGIKAIRIYLNNSSEVFAEVPVVNGKWRYDFAAHNKSLEDGINNISVSGVGESGFESDKSKSFNVDINTIPPSLVTFDSAHVDENGNIDTLGTGRKTNDNTPMFNGKGETGNIIHIYDENNNEIGVGKVALGNWQIQITKKLPNGKHTFTAIAEDAYGNRMETGAKFELDIYNGEVMKPVIAEIIDQVGDGVVDKTGVIDSNVDGGLTNDRTPLLKGTAIQGYKVSIYINGSSVPVATVIAGENGRWSYQVGPNLIGEGKNTFQVRYIDEYGNVSELSEAYLINLDYTPPAAPAITGIVDNVPDFVGLVTENGKKINDKSPEVRGTIAKGDGTKYVHVYVDGVFHGTATIDYTTEPPSWSYKINSLLNDGQHTIKTVGIDAAGNKTNIENSGSFAFIVDTTPPQLITAITGARKTKNPNGHDENLKADDDVLNSGSYINQKTPELFGTTDYNTEVHIYILSSDGTTWIDIGHVMSDAAGNWKFSVPSVLPDGTPLPEGIAAFKVKAVDDVGNWTDFSKGEFILHIDTIPPTNVAILQVWDNVEGGFFDENIIQNGVTNDPRPEFSGTAEAGTKLYIYDTYGENPDVPVAVIDPVPSSGVWSWQPTGNLSQGTHSFYIKAVDKAGNETVSKPWAFDVDLTRPDAPVITSVVDNKDPISGPLQDNSSTNDNRPLFSGTVAKGTIIKVYIDGVETTEQVIITDAGDHYNWSWQASKAFAEGQHTVKFVSVNQATGNVCEKPSEFSFDVDTIAPEAPVICKDYSCNEIFGEQYNNKAFYTLYGTAEAGTTVIIYDNGVEVARVSAYGRGFWQWSTSGRISEGDHEYRAVAIDEAGNTSEMSAPAIFHYSTKTPNKPIITDIYDDTGLITGTIDDRKHTDDKHPTVKGTGKPGSQIAVLANGVGVGYTTVGEDGKWSVEIIYEDKTDPYKFYDMNLQITAIQYDEYGNKSGQSDNIWNIYIESKGIALPPHDVWKDAKEGAYEKNESIKLTQDDLAFKLRNGKVLVYEGDKVIASTDTDGNGNFELIIPPGEANVWHKYTFGFANEIGALVKGTGSRNVRPGAIRGNYDESTSKRDGDYYMWSDVPAAKPKVVMVKAFQGKKYGEVGGFTYPESYAQEDHIITHGQVDMKLVVLAGDPYTGHYKVFIDGVEISRYSVNWVEHQSGRAQIVSIPIDQYANKPGDHTVQVQYVAADGTKSALSDAWTYTYWQGQPDPVTIDAYHASRYEYNSDIEDFDNGAITNRVYNATITGKATRYATVEIYDVIFGNLKKLGETIAKADGSWTFSIKDSFRGVDLSHKVMHLTAKQIDVEGFESDRGQAFDLIIDTARPDAPRINEIIDHEGDIQGSVSLMDLITDDKMPEFKGFSEPGSLVIAYILRDGKLIEAGRVRLGSDEREWSIKLNIPLVEGENTIKFRAVDEAGNVNESDSTVVIKLDTTAPDGPTIKQVTNSEGHDIENDGYTNDQAPIFHGVAEFGSVIKFVEILADGTERVLGSTTVDDFNGNWVFKLPENMKLSEGTHTIKVSAADTVGNVNHLVDAKFVVHVDITPPSKPDGNQFGIYDDNDKSIGWGHATADMKPTFKGTGRDGEKITIYDGDTILGATEVVGGTWSFTPKKLMEVREHFISFSVTDKAGNVSDRSEPVNFKIDQNAPKLLRSAEADDDHSADHIVDTQSDEQYHAKSEESAPKHEDSEQGYSLNNLFSNTALSRMAENATDGRADDKAMKVELDRSNLFEGSKGEINLDKIANLTEKDAAKHADNADAETNKGLDSTIKQTETSPKLDELNLQVLDLKVANTGSTGHTSATNTEMKNSDLEHLLHLQQSQVAG